MSASAESLDSISCNSNSLISILDQVFQPTSKPCTAPNSVVNSSKANSLFTSYSNRSESTNNSSPKTELLVSDIINFEDPGQDIGSITEENGSCSELNVSCIANPMEISIELTEKISPTKEQLSYCTNVNDTNQEDDEVEVVVEDANSSGIFTSFNTNLTDVSIQAIPQSPKARKIIKHALKKCYSFSDIDIRRILSLSKRSESIQTFTSINATLSIEIERSPDSGNTTSDIKINPKHRLISQDHYQNKIILKDRVKRIWSRNKFKLDRQSRFKHRVFDGNEDHRDNDIIDLDQYRRSVALSFASKGKMSYYGFFENLFRCFLNLNLIDDVFFYSDNDNITRYAYVTLEPLNHGDGDVVAMASNHVPSRNITLRRHNYLQGDDRSEISEPFVEEEKLTPDIKAVIRKDMISYSTVVRTIVNYRQLFLIAGGIFVMLPMCHKMLKWFSAYVNLPSKPRMPSIPQCVAPIGMTTKPHYYISSALKGHMPVNRIFRMYYHRVD